ncbi:PREDICTED: F-box protein PP2-B1-like [Fragaria vesca subsp. vesca]|uniref:F-box protein PP2-B1-like n=1 Tax=Fragaria vesca subsp. vesca TaxID=101020 RepID=UPI0002C36687|nr:PREDICTED: F-box protein PP2-B1-like [Fragaria vesca subsp. vesca]
MDNGKMSFSLDKWSGKKCYMICARELFIVWAQDKSRYWSWISVAESRFKEVASLDEVCWLEIRGKIDMSILSPWTLYKAYLVYKLTKRHYGFNVPVEVAIAERHYGFEYGPLDAALGDDENKQTVYLDPSLKIMDGARHPNEKSGRLVGDGAGESRSGQKERNTPRPEARQDISEPKAKKPCFSRF